MVSVVLDSSCTFHWWFVSSPAEPRLATMELVRPRWWGCGNAEAVTVAWEKDHAGAEAHHTDIEVPGLVVVPWKTRVLESWYPEVQVGGAFEVTCIL